MAHVGIMLQPCWGRHLRMSAEGPENYDRSAFQVSKGIRSPTGALSEVKTLAEGAIFGSKVKTSPKIGARKRREKGKVFAF